MNKSEKKIWVKKLKPHWEKYQDLKELFSQQRMILENCMKEKLGEDLEFFYVDGECVGIGHTDLSKRKKFPLFQREELEVINEHT